MFRQADPHPHPRARLLRRVSAYCRFGWLTALDNRPHVGASESRALRRRSVTQDGLDRDGIPVHVVLPPVRGAALGGSSACLAACFGSCVHKRVATQAHIPSAVAEAPRCAATRPTGSGPLTGRETEPRQHEEARLGWLDRGPLPGPCHPDQTFLPLMADIPQLHKLSGFTRCPRAPRIAVLR